VGQPREGLFYAPQAPFKVTLSGAFFVSYWYFFAKTFFLPFPFLFRLAKFQRKKCNSVTILQRIKKESFTGYTFWLHFFMVTKKSVT
jgi:hypothetical protein